MKRLLQPFFIAFSALVLTFLFFVFHEYYQPKFAYRIFMVDVFGLLGYSVLFYILFPNYNSIFIRSLLIVFFYFTTYETIDTLMYYLKHHLININTRTDMAEAEAAVITFGFTFLIGLIFQMSQKKN